jgi:hypothetical protein
MKKYLTSKLNYCRNNLSYVNRLTNLFTISMTIVLMIIVNTSVISQCDEKLDFCNFKKVEPPLQAVHYIIHFDSKGRITGGIPTILRKGDYIRFAIDGDDATLLETKLKLMNQIMLS